MSGYVYFITSEPDEFVKIGWALHNPKMRLSELQTGCPHPLRLMAFVPASREEERRLHRTFAELRYRGEWFFLDQKLRDFVEYLSDDYPRPTRFGASRRVFEDAIWDVVVTGYHHPYRPDPENYTRSGDGSWWQHMHEKYA